MKPRNGFIIIIFFLLFLSPFLTNAQDKCRKVDVTVEITDSEGRKGGSIKVSAKESGAEFTLHLIAKGKSKKNNQLSITTGIIENIPPGQYDLVIHYPEGVICSDTRKVTIN